MYCRPKVTYIHLNLKISYIRFTLTGGGVFENDKGLKCQIPGANLNDIANQADDLLEVGWRA